jgi:DASS family divalent anion:Na+ symporter
MTTVPASGPDAKRNGGLLPGWLAWSLILGLGVAIAILRPGSGAPGVTANGWKLLAVFLPCILALMLQPIPGGAVVLLAVLATVLVGALPLATALGGYADPAVWLVLAAYFLARAFIKTGLARRIALLFIRKIGHTTLGLSYAIVASNTVLAGMIPSNAARVGGVMLPITQSLADLYKSSPGTSAALIGSYLMLALYQGDVMACALFFTGQSSNPLAARQGAELTSGLASGPVVLGYGSWLWYACVPAILSLLVIPLLLFRWARPQITHTPQAAEFARTELETMGRPQRAEWILIGIFTVTCAAWIFGGAANVTLFALAAAVALLLTGVLVWEDIVTDRAAWDVFIWYGGLIQLGKQLKETGLLNVFASNIASNFTSWHWLPLFVVMLLIYFYAHYAFASITTHLVSLYPAFVAVLLATGAPPGLVVLSFACFGNFSAGLTHYGTTPAPIVFGLGYTSLGTWWRIGFLMSLANVAVWLTAGMLWWRVVGLW